MKEPSELFLTDAVTGNRTEFLSGRKELIKDISNHLASDHLSCVVYGGRGVGKTTIAWQVLSILEDINNTYKKNQILEFGKKKKFLTAYHKCRSDITNVDDLLFDIIADSQDRFSFGKRISKLLDSVTITKISHKFKINLFGLLDYNIGIDEKLTDYPHLSEDIRKKIISHASKRTIFKSLLAEIKENHDVEVVIFLDEMDRISNNQSKDDFVPIKGLGEFIKDNELAQFVLIGIGENIGDILSDHQSAGRKLNGGDFPVPLLTNNEIKWIFDNAINLSNKQFNYTDEYISSAILYSGGMPWIAQNIGYHTVHGRYEKNTIYDINDLERAIDKTISIYKHQSGLTLDFSAVESTAETGVEVIKYILNHPNGASEKSIREHVPSPNKRFVSGVLEKLIELSLFKKINDKYYFYDPVVRIFANQYIIKN